MLTAEDLSCEDTQFPKKKILVLVTISKSMRQKMNVSFDDLNNDKGSQNLPPASGLNSNINVTCEQRSVLGSLV